MHQGIGRESVIIYPWTRITRVHFNLWIWRHQWCVKNQYKRQNHRWLILQYIRKDMYTFCYALLCFPCIMVPIFSWWRHQMETFSALLARCEGNSPVTGEFPSQRPVTQSFDVFFDLALNKQLSKQLKLRWFVTPLGLLWRHCNVGIYLPIFEKFVSGSGVTLASKWRVGHSQLSRAFESPWRPWRENCVWREWWWLFEENRWERNNMKYELNIWMLYIWYTYHKCIEYTPYTCT